MAPITAIVIGCGARGRCYADYALLRPDELKIVAAADPSPTAISYMIRTFGLGQSQVANDWRELIGRGRLADAALICTQDRDHYEPCQACKLIGYHILLEKPMAVDALQCARIARSDWLRGADQLLLVCHVLRHLPAVIRLRQLLRSGTIGQLIHVQHTEPIGHVHFAHSYVRGNWRNQDESTFALLAKCCHDVDLICYWMPAACTRVSSFGSLRHFTSRNKPELAAHCCTDCCVEATCPYSALRAYVDPQLWSTAAVCDSETLSHSQSERRQQIIESLRTGPYGRCVYECDNDVCDHQIVNFEFSDGATAALTMMAFTNNASTCTRSTKFYGSLGELEWNGSAYGDCAIVHHDFVNLTHKRIPVEKPDTLPHGRSGRMSGHGGADYFLMESFVRALLPGGSEAKAILQRELSEATLSSHLVTFAAETARREGRVIDVQQFVQQLLQQIE